MNAKISITFNNSSHTIRHTDDGLVNLTDLWKAAGSPEDHRPVDWARKAGRPFIEYAQANGGLGHVFEVKRGRYGGTFATREITIAYAQWISPAFQMVVCRVFLEKWDSHHEAPRMEDGGLTSLLSDLRTMVGDIQSRAVINANPSDFRTLREHCRKKGIQLRGDQQYQYANRLLEFCAEYGMVPAKIPSQRYPNGINVYPVVALEAVIGE